MFESLPQNLRSCLKWGAIASHQGGGDTFLPSSCLPLQYYPEKSHTIYRKHPSCGLHPHAAAQTGHRHLGLGSALHCSCLKGSIITIKSISPRAECFPARVTFVLNHIHQDTPPAGPGWMCDTHSCYEHSFLSSKLLTELI